jgi:hypothetical protein
MQQDDRGGAAFLRERALEFLVGTVRCAAEGDCEHRTEPHHGDSQNDDDDHRHHPMTHSR